MAGTIATIGMSEVKANFSKVANHCHETKTSITVFKHNKPWVNITPVNEVIEEFITAESLPQDTKNAVEHIDAAVRNNELNSWKTYSSSDELFSDLGIHA